MKTETLTALHEVVAALDSVTKRVSADTNEVIAGNNHVEIIKHFNDMRIATELTKAARESLTKMTDHLSKDVIPDVFKHLAETTGEKPPFVIEGVGRVTVSHRFSCSMPDKEQGIGWLKDHGHGGIVQETVNSSTLAAFAKNLLEVEGKELPPELFKVGTSPYTSITKI